MEFSGAQWCERFPASAALTDLAQPFQDKVRAFFAALEAAGASVKIATTYRPPARAYLMHFCCMVIRGQDPREIPPFDSAGTVAIDWTCGGDLALARASAEAMRAGYGIVYPAALASRHTQRLAIDMAITWKGALQMRNAAGDLITVPNKSSSPNGGNTPALWEIGNSFGVIKLPSDPPHWSSDGH